MKCLPGEEGHAAVEYALILTLMILTVIAVLALIGPAIAMSFRTCTVFSRRPRILFVKR